MGIRHRGSATERTGGGVPRSTLQMASRPNSTISERGLVHIAAGNLIILGMVGVDAAPDLYGKLEGEVVPRMLGMIKINDSLEATITDKQAVIALLRRSLDTVRTTFTQIPDTELERQDLFFGERTTVRRVYMRGLSHMHEHMGQLVGYTRAMGLAAPWPDWRESGRKIIEQGQKVPDSS